MADPHASLPQYQLGHGPLEEIYEAAASGELRLDRALQIAAGREVTSRLSAAYAHAFGFHAARNALKGRWREGLMQHRILLAAARAATGPEARMARIRAEREGLVTVAGVLSHAALGSAYADAMAGGDWLLQTLDPVEEKTLLAETYHYLGVLNLDPFTAHRTFENQDLEHRRWLAQAVQERGPDSIDGLPTVAEALNLAQGFLQQAVQLAEGIQLGDSIKALYQTESWLQGSHPDSFDSSLVGKALEIIDPMADPARWITFAFACLNNKLAVDAEKARQLLAVPLSEWVARLGKSKTFEIVIPLIDFQASRDLQAALNLAEQAYDIMAEEPVELHRCKFYNHILGLFVRIARSAGIDTDGIKDSADYVLKMDAGHDLQAMYLIGLASASMSTDEESLGLLLLDRSQELAPELHRRQQQALSYLRAMLWLGVGSNSMKDLQPRLASAAEAYGNALALTLEGGLPKNTFDLLKRLEDLATTGDFETAKAVLAILRAHSLPAELATGNSGLEVLQSICRLLTPVFAERDIALLTLVWQVAKGRRSAAILASPPAAARGNAPGADEILEKVLEARRSLPAEQQFAGQSTSGDASFELWLTSYLRGDYYDGDQAWERLANLKITFDGLVFDTMASRLPPAASAPVELSQLQQWIDDRTILLITYVGEFVDGRMATYALAITREEAIPQVYVHDTIRNETSSPDGERSAVRSQLGREVGELRRALLEEPGPGPVSSQAQAILQQGLQPFYAITEETLATLSSLGKNHIVVAPHDALHFSPFHLFSAGAAHIVDHFVVTYLPNLALLSTTRCSPHPPARRRWDSACVALGFAAGEGGWQAIPEAVAEARAVADVLHVEPLLDGNATKRQVIDAMESSRCLHIATHGAMDVDSPAFQMLVLHPADDEEAGRLYAYEVLRSDLRALELVSLSACETALGRIDHADNLRGMTTSLFSAGVATVIGTLWPVESHASEKFFTTLYRELSQGCSRCEAFYRAQQETREHFPQYRDWGPFYLAGDWR